MQGKHATIVRPTQERAMVGYLETTRSPHQDRVIFLLSMKTGLRAKAIASLTWAMVTDAAGQIGEAPGPRTRINSLEPCSATLACFLGDTEVPTPSTR